MERPVVIGTAMQHEKVTDDDAAWESRRRTASSGDTHTPANPSTNDDSATTDDAAVSAGSALPPAEETTAAAASAAAPSEEQLRRLCLDLSSAGAHMRRGDPASAESLYRRLLDELHPTEPSANYDGDTCDRLAFYVEARLGLVEVDLCRLRDDSYSGGSPQQRCRLLLRALAHAHAAEDALLGRRDAQQRVEHQRQQLGRLQLRLLSGSVQVKRRLLESRLQALLHKAAATAAVSSGQEVSLPSQRKRRRRRRYNSSGGGGSSVGGGGGGNGRHGSFYNERPFREMRKGSGAVQRSPSLQVEGGSNSPSHRPRQQQQPPRQQPVASFVRQLRDFLVRHAAESRATEEAAAQAPVPAPLATADVAPRKLEEEKMDEGEKLDSLISRFVRTNLQSLKDTQSVPRDLTVSSLRRDQSGQHYLQYSRHYLSFTQSMASSSSLREEMEAAASGLMSDIRRDRLEKALMELQKRLNTSATLPITGKERTAARLARLRSSEVVQPHRLAQEAAVSQADVVAMLKTLLRSLLDIAKAAFDSDQLEEAADLFDTCLDLCRSLTRELGDMDVERYEVPKIHRLLGLIHCRLGDKRRGVSMLTFAAELFEKQLKDDTATPPAASAVSVSDASEVEATSTDADETSGAENVTEEDEGSESGAENGYETAALGLAEIWYDIGCAMLGCDGGGRCGSALLGCLSDALRARCVADMLGLPAPPPPAQPPIPIAVDAMRAFERCRGLLLDRRRWKRRRHFLRQGPRSRRRDRGPSLTEVEIRVATRLADCCFAAGKWEKALGLYEEAQILLGDSGSGPDSSKGGTGGGSGGGRVIDHGHVLRMLGCARLLLLDNRSHAAAVLETSLIMFQHLGKVGSQTEGSWDEELMWVLAPLLACHLSSRGGHHPRALHCARAILANPAASAAPWLTFFANFAAGAAARRLRDPTVAARHLQVAAAPATAARGSNGDSADGCLLACVAEAEAAEAAAATSEDADVDTVVTGHYWRILEHLKKAATDGSRSVHSPTVAAACLRGAEFFHDLGRPDASNELLEAHVRCSANSPESLSKRLAELGLLLGTAAMRQGHWDRALGYLKGALGACARNPEGDVGPEGAPILRQLGTLHHARYCQERRDILFENTDVQELQDRCAFSYLQSLELHYHPDCALRLAGFLLTTGQFAEAELYAAEVQDRADATADCQVEAFEAPTLHWGLEAAWPAVLSRQRRRRDQNDNSGDKDCTATEGGDDSLPVFNPRRDVLAAAILACCRSYYSRGWGNGCINKDQSGSDSAAVYWQLRRLLAAVVETAAGPHDRLLVGLALMHHGMASEAALLLAVDCPGDRPPDFLLAWCADVAIIGMAVAMTTSFCCLLHLTNALAGLRTGSENLEEDEDSSPEETQL